MIAAAFKGLLMADEVPTPEEAVPSFLHAFMWACIFGAVDAVIAERRWYVWAGALGLSLASHIVGIYWSWIKSKTGPRFAARLEQIASNRRRYKWVIGIVIVIALLASIGIRVYRHYHTNPNIMSASSTQSPPPGTRQLPIHTLLVRYEQGILPIRITPHDTAYISQLSPNISEWVWEVPNGGRTPIRWPKDIHPPPPGDFIYVCELTNNEDKTLLAVSVSFNVSFHELEMVPVTVTKNKSGGESISMPSPGSDHVVVTLGHPKEAKNLTAARDGAVVKQFTHPISLPSIGPGSTAKIYLVNQSKFISKFTLPTQATAIVAGNAQRIQVALVRPNVTVQDVLPWFGLAPSTYHWEGVPGSP
jgi:hypothetical protein